MKHIPNIISGIRLLLIGVFVYLFVNEQYLASFVIYVIAFMSDLLDGYLARRNGWVTALGKVLDPLADKLLLVSALILFFINNNIPLYVLIIVFIKDLALIVGGAIMYLKKYDVKADWIGKIAAGLFMLAVGATFLNILFSLISWYLWFYYAAIVVSVAAFAHYGIMAVINNRRK